MYNNKLYALHLYADEAEKIKVNDNITFSDYSKCNRIVMSKVVEINDYYSLGIKYRKIIIHKFGYTKDNMQEEVSYDYDDNYTSSEFIVEKEELSISDLTDDFYVVAFDVV